jgi:hypothetical protein
MRSVSLLSPPERAKVPWPTRRRVASRTRPDRPTAKAAARNPWISVAGQTRPRIVDRCRLRGGLTRSAGGRLQGFSGIGCHPRRLHEPAEASKTITAL